MTATQWLEVLASFSVQVLVVVVVCKLLARTLVRSADRGSIWTACFFCILSLAAAGLLLPRLHLLQPWAWLEPETILSVSTIQTVIGKLLLLVLCTGACASLIIWIARAYLLRSLLGRCDELPNENVQSLFDQCSRDLNCRSLPRVLISSEVQGPFCLQLHQPTIVLPRYLLEGSKDDLRYVIAHEFEHLCTGHPLHLFLQHLVEVTCWFHPAVWNAAWHASMVREFICDDAAVAQASNCAPYLRTLLRIAERGEQNKHSSGIAFGRAPSELVLRARRLVSAATATSLRQGFRLPGRKAAICILLCITGSMAVVTIPLDPLSSSRSLWSPWPSWTAKTFHCFGLTLRDYELFDRRVQVYELQRVCRAPKRAKRDQLVDD